MRRLPLLAVPLLVALCVVAGVAWATGGPLQGTVGPGFAISLADSSGAAVQHVDPGAYTLAVDDKSDAHSFHLTGPGVDVGSTVEGTGEEAFSVALQAGTYTFFCDAHPTTMRGTFTVGALGNPPPTTTTTPAPPPRLTLVVGDRAVTLERGGAAVRRLRAGAYVVRVVDRTKRRGVRLAGAGANRRTGIAFVGTVTWTVTLTPGTLIVRSDGGSPKLRGGTIRVS